MNGTCEHPDHDEFIRDFIGQHDMRPNPGIVVVSLLTGVIPASEDDGRQTAKWCEICIIATRRKRDKQIHRFGLFYNWLKYYKTEDTVMGDLASDVSEDMNFPKNSDSKDEIRQHLNQKHAGPNMLGAFDEGWNKYKDERTRFENISHILQKIHFLT